MVRDQVKSPGVVGMAACPLMHGTGLYTQLIILSLGGSSVTLTSRRLDIEEMFDTIERERVNQIAIVGDSSASPWCGRSTSTRTAGTWPACSWWRRRA